MIMHANISTKVQSFPTPRCAPYTSQPWQLRRRPAHGAMRVDTIIKLCCCPRCARHHRTSATRSFQPRRSGCFLHMETVCFSSLTWRCCTRSSSSAMHLLVFFWGCDLGSPHCLVRRNASNACYSCTDREFSHHRHQQATHGRWLRTALARTAPSSWQAWCYPACFVASPGHTQPLPRSSSSLCSLSSPPPQSA